MLTGKTDTVKTCSVNEYNSLRMQICTRLKGIKIFILFDLIFRTLYQKKIQKNFLIIL